MSPVTILCRRLARPSVVPTVALMSRPRRAELAPGRYHLVSRGAGGIDVYRDDDDRRLFLHLFARTVRRMRWTCRAYCLMTNHFHLLVQTTAPNLSAGMHVLVGTYARGFNERHSRRGHLFGARFHSTEIEDDEGMCPASADWPWCGLERIAYPPA
jgi:putative transposase